MVAHSARKQQKQRQITSEAITEKRVHTHSRSWWRKPSVPLRLSFINEFKLVSVSDGDRDGGRNRGDEV